MSGTMPKMLYSVDRIGLAIFLGAHTVIAGYTTIDAIGWIRSGLCESAGPSVSMVAIGFAYRDRNVT